MPRIGRRYRTNRAETHYDVIVVGSGIGGLCTAALLSRLGKKVCVLEQHYTAGGYTHSYEREGYEWDVGVHYIGEVHKPWSMIRRVFDTITDGELQWAPMDPLYDRVLIGGETYEFVAGEAPFKASLKSRFPDDAEAIDRYVDMIKTVNSKVPAFFAGQALPRPVARLYRLARRRLLPTYCFQTTREVLEGLTTNETLIGVLTAQWGDYGLPPSESSFLMHAMVAKHYLTGGNYPVGGASSIAATILPVIRAGGGEVFTYASVEEILIKGNRAYGVRMANGDEILGDAIVSGIGIVPTVKRLLPEKVARRHGFDRHLRDVHLSASHVCLYVGLKGTARDLGIPRTNDWIYPSYDHDANVAAFRANPEAPMPLVYVSFPSAKDPAWDEHYPGRATVEVVAPTNNALFDKWVGSTWNKRGEDYDALKETIAQELLEVLFKHRPQLRDALDYYELSTPLSTRWFQHNEEGEIYGIDHTVKRFDQGWLHPITPVKNLYLTGSDVVTAGVGGALMAGVMTACAMVGWRSYRVWQLIRQPVRTMALQGAPEAP